MCTSRNTMSFDAGRACELLVVDEDHVVVEQGVVVFGRYTDQM